MLFRTTEQHFRLSVNSSSSRMGLLRMQALPRHMGWQDMQGACPQLGHDMLRLCLRHKL